MSQSRIAAAIAAAFAVRTPLAVKLGSPFWPNRPPAPWRIRALHEVWAIEKRVADGWEVHQYCATGPDAFATFARGGR